MKIHILVIKALGLAYSGPDTYLTSICQKGFRNPKEAAEYIPEYSRSLRNNLEADPNYAWLERYMSPRIEEIEL